MIALSCRRLNNVKYEEVKTEKDDDERKSQRRSDGCPVVKTTYVDFSLKLVALVYQCCLFFPAADYTSLGLALLVHERKTLFSDYCCSSVNTFIIFGRFIVPYLRRLLLEQLFVRFLLLRLLEYLLCRRLCMCILLLLIIIICMTRSSDGKYYCIPLIKTC